MLDAYGNAVTNRATAIAMALGSNPAGGTLAGATTAATSAGTATFSTLRIDKAGGYTLRASATGLPTATSVAFHVVVGPAYRLGFLVQPSAARAGVAIAPAVQVVALDRGGNKVTAATGSVSVNLSTNPAGGVLSGTRTVALSGGVARFADLKVGKAGSGFVLRAAAARLAGAYSNPFSVSP